MKSCRITVFAFTGTILAALFLFVSGSVYAEQSVTELCAKMNAGPAVYYTDAAQSYFLARGQAVDRGIDKNVAELALRSVLALGDMGSAAWSAINNIVTRMPKAVHVVSTTENYSPGAGTFEDWVATMLMSEKNKIMLNPPFLNYEALSACEQYFDVQKEIIRSDDGVTVTIHMIFTFHAGACALSRITGVPLGPDEQQWQAWWDQNRHLAPSAVAPEQKPASGTGITGTSAADLVTGGEYRIYLNTGDVLHGRIESNDGGVIIMEDYDKGGFSFNPKLIDQYELLALPKKKLAVGAGGPKGAVTEAEIFTFEELLRRNPTGKELEVKIASGATFQGRLLEIDKEKLVLDIDGSKIPITATVIASISTVVAAPAVVAAAVEPVKPSLEGPFDTVYVVNPEVDDWGKPLPNQVLVGKAKDNPDGIDMTLMDGTVKQIARANIVRVTKATVADFQNAIKRYAKPLFCPDEMLLVDIPPGKDGRPFFKVCIDKYEFPNVEGGLPRGDVSYSEAVKTCKAQGKRLCTAQEWQWSCSGLEGYTYPYGWNYDKKLCNSKGIGKWDPAGSNTHCVSKFGVYDLSGNIFEWVVEKDGSPVVMGGPYSKCNVASPGAGGEAKPQIGFRCCKSN